MSAGWDHYIRRFCGAIRKNEAELIVIHEKKIIHWQPKIGVLEFKAYLLKLKVTMKS